jgi:hypothetical protein
MRIINSVLWTSQELETYRLQIFLNLVQGMRLLLDCLKDMSENPPPSLSLSTALPPSSPYLTSPQSSHSPYPSPSPVNTPASFNARQRSGSISSNATLMTTHSATTLGGNPSPPQPKPPQRPLLPRRKLTYSARHAQLQVRLDNLPDLREGDPFPPDVGGILTELWGIEPGVEWVGSRKISVARGEEAERVVEIDAKGTSAGQNDLRECVERAKVGGNLPDK